MEQTVSNFDLHHESILTIYDRNVTETVSSSKVEYFPTSHIQCCALFGETENPEIINAACCFTRNTKHINSITWSQLNHPSLEPPFAVNVIDFMHETQNYFAVVSTALFKST